MKYIGTYEKVKLKEIKLKDPKDDIYAYNDEIEEIAEKFAALKIICFW